MNYLQPVPDAEVLAHMSSLALAHIGDAVYEIMVRGLLACDGTQTAHGLHHRTTQLVCAAAQAKAAALLLPLLSEEEAAVFRRGRNAKPKSVPRAATVAQYAHATALEALLGWLYLQGRYARINELFGVIAHTVTP